MAPQKYLHVVAFNVPYPPDYGGIIDIYYKLKALSEDGTRIILHSFLYERPEAPELEQICHEVHYYKRLRGLKYFLHTMPYIVITRQSRALEERLLNDDHPVLFEGLHTTFHMKKCIDAGKRVFVRTHNIEHNYYRMLANSTRLSFKKLFLTAEARKLKKYEPILEQADRLIAISTTDATYFSDQYGNSTYVSAFHHHDEVTAMPGSGDYILFHGNLSVPENEKALLFLVRKVLSQINFRVIIAGKNPARVIRRTCDRYPHIELVSNPSGEQMDRLVSGAHINLLYTYQPTGLKLKLLHSLYSGRHCMANPLMLSGSVLEPLCRVYRSPAEAIELIEQLMQEPFSEEQILERQKILAEYHNSYNVKKLNELLGFS
jgi:hypothetical protein